MNTGSFKAAADAAAVPAALALATVLVCLVLVSVVLTHKALRDRRCLQMLPTLTFAPSMEDVRRFAAAVSSTRRSLRDWLTKKAEGVRFRLTTDVDGKVCSYVEGSPRALAIISAAVLPEVELREVPREEMGGESLRRLPKVRRQRVEMRPHRDGTHAFAALELDPDPLTPFARVLGDLAETEQAEVTVDLMPLRPGAKRRLLKKAMRTEGTRSESNWQRDLAQVIGMKSSKNNAWSPVGDGGLFSFGESTITRMEDRADDKARHTKLAGGEPAFRAQMLVSASAGTRTRARDLARGVEAGFAPFSDRNRWRATGVARLFGAQSLWRRAHFDRRARTGMFWPMADSIVVASEIAAFLKPPTASCPVSAVARSGGLIPPAPARLPDYVRGQGLMPLGIIRERTDERLVGQPLDGNFFSLACGKTRAGKTQQAISRFLAAVHEGYGACYFDPHADAVALCRRYLLPFADRLLDLDFSRTASAQPGLNLLSMVGYGPEHIGQRAKTLSRAFAAVLDWDAARNNRGLNLTNQGASALCELNLLLPPELQANIFVLPRLFTDERWRAEILPYVSAHSREFLTDRLITQTGGKEATSPVTNIIDNLRRSRQVAAVLGQPQTTFDLRRAMDTGMAVLLCPAVPDADTAFVHALLLFEIRRVAATRMEMPESQRRAFMVWADEMQVADRGAGSDLLREILRECAKWGLYFHGLTQQPSALTPETRTTFLTNSFGVYANTLGREDANVLAKEWGGDVEATVLSRLRRYSYLASITRDGSLTPPFLVRGLSVEELWGKAGSDEDVALLDRAVDANMRRRPVSEVVDDLDSQPDRIVRWLRQHQPRPPVPGVPTSAPARRRPRAAPVTPVLAVGAEPAPSGRSPARERARRRWSAQ